MTSRINSVAKCNPTKPKLGRPNSMQVQTSNALSNLDDTIENFMYEDHQQNFKASLARVKELLFRNPGGIERELIPVIYETTFQQPLVFSDIRCKDLEELCSKLSNNKLIQMRYGNQGKLFAYPVKEFLMKYKDEQNEKRLAETDFNKFFDIGLNTTLNLPNNIAGPKEEIPVESWENYEHSGCLDLYVSEVESPSNFYVQLRQKREELDELMHNMENYYVENHHKLELKRFRKGILGMYVAAVFAETHGYDHIKPIYVGWHRAKITQVMGSHVRIFFIDYGTFRDVGFHLLRFLHKKFTSLPAQALRATLAGIIPRQNHQETTQELCNSKWAEPTVRRFFDLVSITNDHHLPVRGIVGHVVKTPWKSHDRNLNLKIPLMLFDTVTNMFEHGILINEQLIKQEHADKDPSYMTNDGLLPWEHEAKKTLLLKEDKRIKESMRNLDITEALIPSRQESPDGFNENLRSELHAQEPCAKELEPPPEVVDKARSKVENWLLNCQQNNT